MTKSTEKIHWGNVRNDSCTACGHYRDNDEIAGPQRLTEAIMNGENVCSVCAQKLREWSKK